MREVPISRKMTIKEIQEAFSQYQELIKSNTKKASLAILAEKYPVTPRTLYRYFNKIDKDGNIELQQTAKRATSFYDLNVLEEAYQEHKQGIPLIKLQEKYDIPKSTLSRHFIKLKEAGI